jgi:hypothetical protein
MLFLLTIIFPPALMLAVLAMERIERPLIDQKIGEEVADLIGSGAVADVEGIVTRTAAGPVDRHWRRRQRLARIARFRSTRATVRG